MRSLAFPHEEPAGIASIAPPDYMGGLHTTRGHPQRTARTRPDRPGTLHRHQPAGDHRVVLGAVLGGARTWVCPRQSATATGCRGLRQRRHLPGRGRRPSGWPIEVPERRGVASRSPRSLNGQSSNRTRWQRTSQPCRPTHTKLLPTVLPTTTRSTRSSPRGRRVAAPNRLPLELQAVGVVAYEVLDHRGVLADPQVHDRRPYSVAPCPRLGTGPLRARPAAHERGRRRTSRAQVRTWAVTPSTC